MQVFVERLRSTETTCIRNAQVYILCRIEAEIGTRTEDDVVNQVVLVQSSTQEKAPLLVLPFVLEEEATYAHILLEVAVVAEDDILQAVEVVFCAKCQVGWHEEQLAE